MAAKILATTLLLASSAASVSAAPSRVGSSGSRNFKLTAQLETALSGGPNVEDYEVGIYSPKPDGGILTLTEPGEGAVFTGGTHNQTLSVAAGAGSGSGNSTGFSCSSGAAGQWVVAPGGTATVPSTNTVNVCCPTSAGGSGVIGSSGFTIASNGTSAASAGILNFVGGGWMACQGGVLGVNDDYNVLSFIKDGQRPILGCQDIELIPVYV
ncbi:hypothetical protein SLS62_004895 [Diatrype stigma]|uniref:Uncharacterized protein n=1 Tax=Diatrype stigma TaxID=117547 RepID=A0AAN9UTY3_9PEZI